MKVLIIGCGGQGVLADAPGSFNEHKVISFAKAFKERDAELIFFDTDLSKSRFATDIWGGTYVQKISDAFFDIAVVTTPDETHYEILKLLSNLGAKLVICEKPLCTDVEQIKEIVKLYKDLGIPLMVDFTRRFIDRYRFLKSDYRRGKLGKFVYGRCIFNRGIWHTGSHAVDLFNWMFRGNSNNFEIIESEITDVRVWDLMLVFEQKTFMERRIGNMAVPWWFNFHTRDVVDNAMGFLEGKKPLYSLGEYSIEGAEKLCWIREKRKQ